MDAKTYAASKGYTEKYTQPTHIFNEYKCNIDLTDENQNYYLYKVGDFIPQKGMTNEIIVNIIPKKHPENKGSILINDEMPVQVGLEGNGLISLIPNYPGMCGFCYEETEYAGIELVPGAYFVQFLEKIKDLFDQYEIEVEIECLCYTYKTLGEKFLENPKKDFYIPFDFNFLNDMVPHESYIEVDEELVEPLISKVVANSNLNFSFQMPTMDNDSMFCFPLEHIGMGVFKTFCLANLYFHFDVENTTNRLYFLRMEEFNFPDSASTYSTRQIPLSERILESLDSRGLTPEKLKNRFNNKNGITDLISKIPKDE